MPALVTNTTDSNINFHNINCINPPNTSCADPHDANCLDPCDTNCLDFHNADRYILHIANHINLPDVNCVGNWNKKHCTLLMVSILGCHGANPRCSDHLYYRGKCGETPLKWPACIFSLSSHLFINEGKELMCVVVKL